MTQFSVKCYDKLRIMHSATSKFLHSHDIKLKNSSNLEVVAHKLKEENNWFVAVAKDPAKRQPMYQFQSGDGVMLVHMNSKRKIHMGQKLQGLQFQVFGCDNSSCKQDVWIIESTQSKWLKDTQFKLLHQKNKAFLHSHKKKTKLTGMQEVSAFLDPQNQQETFWVVVDVQPFIYSAPPKLSRMTGDDELQDLKKKSKQSRTGSQSILSPEIQQRNQKKSLISTSRKLQKQRKEREALQIIVRREQQNCLRKYFCCCMGSGSDYSLL